VPELVLWHWLAFGTLVVTLLTLDLFVFHNKDHAPSLGESAWWTIFWIGLAVVFNIVIWWWGGAEIGMAFLAGYLIEKSLSMDNIFVFVVIFRFFSVPLMYQYRVLFWGILGAVFMRLAFILAGVELLHNFEWVAAVFGAFLVYTAYKLFLHGGADEVHPEKNIVLKIARRIFRITKDGHEKHGNAFFVRQDGLIYITPMFLVLLVVESTDVVFAVDSVPAVIGVIPSTFEPSMVMFIAFTSNVFAILGLRALYFLLAGMVEVFKYLHFGLAAVLGFVGVKMMAEYFVEHEEGTHLVPTWASLTVIAALLTMSIVASIVVGRTEETHAEPEK